MKLSKIASFVVGWRIPSAPDSAKKKKGTEQAARAGAEISSGQLHPRITIIFSHPLLPPHYLTHLLHKNPPYLHLDHHATTKMSESLGTPLPGTAPDTSISISISQLFAEMPKTFIFLGHEYSVLQIIRMIVILGGYLLIRPMLLKLAGKAQQAAHEKEETQGEEGAAMASGRQIPGEEEEEDERGGVKWGAAARRRERERIERMEERLREEESDDELEAMLSGP